MLEQADASGKKAKEGTTTPIKINPVGGPLRRCEDGKVPKTTALQTWGRWIWDSYYY